MPPPEFPEIVLELTVTSPSARMPPPKSAELPETVLELTVTFPIGVDAAARGQFLRSCWN